MVYNLETNESTTPTEPLESIDVKWCETDTDFESLAEVTFVKRNLLPAGMRGMIAASDGVTSGGIWICENQPFPESELGISIDLAPHQAWLFGARVDPEFRGRGVYNRILGFATDELSRAGKRELLVAVNPDNRASDHVHKRWSKETVGKVIAVRIFQCVMCCCFGKTHCDRAISINGNRTPILVTANRGETICQH